MPKRSYASTQTNKKRGRYARQRKPYIQRPIRGTSIVKGGSGIGLPDRMYFKFKYADSGTLSIVTGSPQTLKYSCNGLHDPDISGVGHQPYYWDQISPLYNHYVVLGAKIKYTLTKFESTTDVPVAVALWVEDDLTFTPGSVVNALEQGRKNTIIGCDNAVTMVEHNWSAKKTWKDPLSRTDIRGSPGSNPSEQQFFYLMANTMDTAASAVVYYMVEIEYFACLYEKTSPAPS